MKNYYFNLKTNEIIININNNIIIINYSKNYKNKISLFYNNNFISDFIYISQAELYVLKHLNK